MMKKFRETQVFQWSLKCPNIPKIHSYGKSQIKHCQVKLRRHAKHDRVSRIEHGLKIDINEKKTKMSEIWISCRV